MHKIDENEYYSKVIDILNMGEGNFILRVERKEINFNPGQFFSIGIDSLSINREYSVASSAKEDYIDFYIREVIDGSLTPNLRNLKKGEQIKILGPYGEFYLREYDPSKEYIFFATGTGLAPFISIIQEFNIENYKVFHGIRKYEDIYTNFKFKNYNLAISRESNKNENLKEKNIYQILNGRIDLFMEQIDFKDNMLFFLCGNSQMVTSLYDGLIHKKVNPTKIFTEIFF